ncbi:hypothetical protein DASB73_016080 [Starmerella bacillaris]|uniref:Carbohydrate kinase PfkB domain-containing protein n=1 Tax=Starmerella bacillaris TaxID=1247836 RepID=A0AAV5RGJ8_STABA|nr:hypothetical protein DASB73_016080 [Starmerella bacillaris]
MIRRFSRLAISEEVRHAVGVGNPVVALESTIITHGLPYPRNVRMATEVEQVIRSKGCTPATIAFINGTAKVGLTPSELEDLGNTAGKDLLKISKRDIPFVLANKLSGGSTVASTMILAHKAGINVFATGGLGGVHRDVHKTWDISADLEELGRTPVAVVCSGVKSILDISKTAEYLETKGCLISTFGQKNMPNFFTTDSGVPSPYTFNTANEAAKLIYAGNNFDLNTGYMFCVPPPKEVALDKLNMDGIIDEALAQASKQAISGKNITPFLLQKVWEATGGVSIDTNVALVKNNAEMAADIAISLSQLKRTEKVSVHPVDISPKSQKAAHEPALKPTPASAPKLDNNAHKHTHKHSHSHSHDESSCTSCASHSHDPPPGYHANPDVIAVGSLNEDITCTMPIDDPDMKGTSYPGKIQSTIGGIGYNVALASSLYGAPTGLLTSIGRSSTLVPAVRNSMNLLHVDEGTHNSRYVSLNGSNGDMLVACAESGVSLDPSVIFEKLDTKQPKVVVMDANIDKDQMNAVMKYRKNNNKSCLIFEPTSAPKASRIAKCNLGVYPNQSVDIITPNKAELLSIFEEFMKVEKFDVENWLPIVMASPVGTQENRMKMFQFTQKHAALKEIEKEGVIKACIRLLPFFPNIYVTLGEAGVLTAKLFDPAEETITGQDSSGTLLLQDPNYTFAVQFDYYEPTPGISVASVNGAGDSFCGVLAAQISNSPNQGYSRFIKTAMKAAELSLEVVDSVNTSIRDLHFTSFKL